MAQISEKDRRWQKISRFPGHISTRDARHFFSAACDTLLCICKLHPEDYFSRFQFQKGKLFRNGRQRLKPASINARYTDGRAGCKFSYDRIFQLSLRDHPPWAEISNLLKINDFCQTFFGYYTDVSIFSPCLMKVSNFVPK